MSPTRPGRYNKSILYYDLQIQTTDCTYRGVSYREDLRDKLVKSEKNKSPVKLKNIKRKMNFMDNTKTDIEINEETELIEQAEAPFKYRKVMDEICPIVTISQILKEKKHDDKISLHCYVNINNRPITSTKLKHSDVIVNKKEVACNDNTGTIKLTIWGNNISFIKTNGVFFIQQAKVNEYPQGVLSITTTPSSYIRPSTEDIQISKSSLKDLVSYSVKFPPTSVQVLSSTKCCTKCGKSSQSGVQGKLFICEHCQAMSLASKIKSRYSIKLGFENSSKSSVVMYHPQVTEYFQMKSTPIPDDTKLLSFELLSDQATVLIIDSRSVCIGMKPYDD